MAKKITLDVDADVSKARRKVREVAETGGGAATGGADIVSPAAERAASAMTKAAKSTQELGERSRASAEQLVGMTRAFTGLAVGMAASYAAKQFGEDSAIGRGVGYFGSAVSGATTGAMAGKALGPWGMAAGAIIGAGTGAFGKYSEYSKADEEKAKAEKELRDTNLESIETWEKARARTLAFKQTLEALTKSQSGLAAEIEKRKDADIELAKQQREAIGDTTKLNALNRERQTNASEIDALSALLKAAAGGGAYRASIGGADALSRIGGDFGGGRDTFRELAQTGKDQLNVLKRIESKTGGSTTWQ